MSELDIGEIAQRPLRVSVHVTGRPAREIEARVIQEQGPAGQLVYKLAVQEAVQHDIHHDDLPPYHWDVHKYQIGVGGDTNTFCMSTLPPAVSQSPANCSPDARKGPGRSRNESTTINPIEWAAIDALISGLASARIQGDKEQEDLIRGYLRSAWTLAHGRPDSGYIIDPSPQQ